MLKKNLWITALVMLFLIAACGQSGNEPDTMNSLHDTGFQDNGSNDEYPNFRLNQVFTGWGGLEEMWDSINAKGFNSRFTKTSDDLPDDFITFSHLGSAILSDDSRVVVDLAGKDAGNLLATFIEQDENFPLDAAQTTDDHYYAQGNDYMAGFYDFLDEVFKDGENPGSKDIVSMNWKILSRFKDRKSPQELHDDMQDLVDDILDKDFKKDFTDATTVLGKLLVRADYPQSSNGQNLGIGNSVKGMVDLLKWYNLMEKNPVTRALLRSQATELAKLFDPSPASTNNIKIQKLLSNIKDCFSKDGATYGDTSPNNVYHTDTNEIYSDTELGNTLRELFPSMVQLFMRSDRPNSLITSKDGQNVYLMRQFTKNLNALGFDPETADLETSLYNLMKYDDLGRDRTDPDSGAYAVSHLESLIFLTHVTSNLGWADRDEVSSDEVTDSTDPRYDHGHGAFTGRLSLNDSLFSMKTHKTMNSLGVYDISLKPDDGNDIYRSRTAFSIANRQDFKFFFDQNYDVLQCLAPADVGDLGTPDGGNSDGQVPAMDSFKAYSPDGLGETQLAAWTLGLIVRTCFNGEGPYYYADPDAENSMIDGKVWYKYKRPNGKIYAYVNKDDPNNWEYFYPADSGDPQDDDPSGLILDGSEQRYNRYKSQWKTDYYLTHFTQETEDEHGNPITIDKFMTIDNSQGFVSSVFPETGGNTSAGQLTYNEIINENEPKRACSSQEEALFRNFQWLMNEKKMVIILPMKVNLDGTEASIYQVLEGNGLTGISDLRKYRGNHFWAKNAGKLNSDIPGDYRLEVISSADGGLSSPLDSYNVYYKTLDCGQSTPSIVVFNMPAFSRLGFPRYTSLKDRGNGISDSSLGSREFEVDGTVWKDRCALLPPFIALVSALREYTPQAAGYDNPLKKGLRTFVEGTSPLIKPMIYYQKESGQHPYQTWKPRVLGSDTAGPSPEWSEYHGDDFLRSSADFHNENQHRASTWDGTIMEKQYYQPAAVKTLLNVLIDSNINMVDGRMDGILPLMMENKSTTRLMSLLLSDANDTPLLYGAIEQIAGVLKLTRGDLIKFNETNAKHIVYPDWMFVTGTSTGDYGEYTDFSGMRDEDIILDRGLDRIIGHVYADSVHDGYGLVQYVDEQKNKDWADLNNNLDFLEDILHSSSPYCILSNVLDYNDAVFARDRLYTDQEVSGLIYGLGKLFTHYDKIKGAWINQGEEGFDDLYKMVAVRLPKIHELMKDKDGFSGNNYMSALAINTDLMKPDGAAEFLVTTMKTEADWQQLFSDSSAFLRDKEVTEYKPLWFNLAELLGDLAKAMENARDGSLLDAVYTSYGFQRN